MRIDRLKQMYNHILLNVPKELLNMWAYRLNCSYATPECNSVGCIIGHCTVLADSLEGFMEEDSIEGPRIKFYQWSIDFLEIPTNKHFQEGVYYDFLWNFMFSSKWSETKYKNDSHHKQQCLARIKFVIEGLFDMKFFEYWKDQYKMAYSFRINKKDYPNILVEEPYSI